jgi:aspartate racemase
MIGLTAEHIAAMKLRHGRVGILASTAVVDLGIYDKALARHGIRTVGPQRQAELMKLIKAVKRGDTGPSTRQIFSQIADELMKDDTDLLLVACTELSLLADSISPDTLCVDALDVLVREIVRFGTETSSSPIPSTC